MFFYRKIFDKISAESRRTQGIVQGNVEVIKGIKNIVDKDQYFADILRINKELNEHKLRISMTSDGQVNLNAQHKFHPSDLHSIGKQERIQLFESLGPADTTLRNVCTKVTPSTTAVGKYVDGEEDNTIVVNIRPGEVLRIGYVLLRISTSGAENIAARLQNLSQELYINLMTVCLSVLSKLVPKEIAKLKLLSPDEDLIDQIVKFVFNYMKHNRPMGEPCRHTDNGIVVVLKDFFQEGMIRQESILVLKDRMVAWFDEQLDHRRQLYPNKKQLICQLCQGVRFA